MDIQKNINMDLRKPAKEDLNLETSNYYMQNAEFASGVSEVIESTFKDLLGLETLTPDIRQEDINKEVCQSILTKMLKEIGKGYISFSARDISLSPEFDLSKIKDNLCGTYINYVEDNNGEIIFIVKSIESLLRHTNQASDKIDATLKRRAEILKQEIAKIKTQIMYCMKRGKNIEVSLLKSVTTRDLLTLSNISYTTPVFTLEEIKALLESLNKKYSAEIVAESRLHIRHVLN